MQNTLNTNEVYTFKLNSGEELIAKVKETGDNWVVLEEPASIAPTQKGIQLIPSMFTSEPKSEVRLNTSSVSLVGTTEDGVKMKYLEMTTGITVPDKKIILG